MTQETLEEAAEYHWKMQYIMALDESTKPYIIQDFISGAKWQAKRMYSEEEVKNMLVDVSNFINTKELKDISDVDFNKWIYKRDYFINFLFDFDMPTDTANEYINSLKQQP